MNREAEDFSKRKFRSQEKSVEGYVNAMMKGIQKFGKMGLAALRDKNDSPLAQKLIAYID